MSLQKLAASFVCGALLLCAQADNTKKNKRDRADSAVTADQQGQSEGDREITRKIRKALTDESTLSTYAKNVKIITKDGKVTLRGPVKTESEKSMVEKFAQTVAGDANVSSEIEIAKK